MTLKVGDPITVESQSADRGAKSGVVTEVVKSGLSPRYRIRWQDGHESIYTPSDGALQSQARSQQHMSA
jgi:hypothetical protein